MLELTLTFSPADGSAPRVITARIGDPERTGKSWSALAEVTGFAQPWSQRIQGADWPQAVELAAQIIPVYLDCLVAGAGAARSIRPSLRASRRTLPSNESLTS